MLILVVLSNMTYVAWFKIVWWTTSNSSKYVDGWNKLSNIHIVCVQSQVTKKTCIIKGGTMVSDCAHFGV